MNDVKIPVIPREVAKAIEYYRGKNASNGAIVERCNSRYYGRCPDALRSIPFDTLLAALVNGYTVEKSVEDIAEDARKAAHERIRIRYHLALLSSDPIEYGYWRGVEQTLNELDVKIPGVNAPEGVNA